MLKISEMLGDVKESVENRIKELEETQDIYKIEIYSDRTNKHLEIYYKGKPYMCILVCMIKKRLTPRYIKALASCVIGGEDSRHKFYLYPENRKINPGKFSDIEYLAKTYYVGKDYKV